MERIALMVELEGWVREAQDRLDAELGAVMSVGREQRSFLKKASTYAQNALFGVLSFRRADQFIFRSR